MSELTNMIIVWHGEKPEGCEDAVMKDMRDNGITGMDPDKLVFHTVWLSDDMEGPSVCVWGEDGQFHAEYEPRQYWSTSHERS